jgi:hypothetical protein
LIVNEQGTVFERVIREVCEASQVDFEEGGVDQHTLEEMKTVSKSFIFPFYRCVAGKGVIMVVWFRNAFEKSSVEIDGYFPLV